MSGNAMNDTPRELVIKVPLEQVIPLHTAKYLTHNGAVYRLTGGIHTYDGTGLACLSYRRIDTDKERGRIENRYTEDVARKQEELARYQEYAAEDRDIMLSRLAHPAELPDGIMPVSLDAGWEENPTFTGGVE